MSIMKLLSIFVLEFFIKQTKRHTSLVEMFSHDEIKYGDAVTDNSGKTKLLWLQQTTKQTEENNSNNSTKKENYEDHDKGFLDELAF